MVLSLVSWICLWLLLLQERFDYIFYTGGVEYGCHVMQAASRHLMVEALVYPDLKDKKLMEYFGCVDITEMPLKVFPTNKEYGHVSKQVLKVLGLTEEDDEAKETEDAKN